MTRTANCPACKEHTVYECVSIDAEGNLGDFRRCNLCNHIRPMQRRFSAKREERNARRAATLEWLLAQAD